MTTEQRFFDLPAGAKHTHAGEDHYGPKRILLPVADHEMLSTVIKQDRAAMIKKPAKVEKEINDR
jgi:hypothetical protein